MNLTISRTGKNGSYLARNDIKLLNGGSINAAIRLDPGSFHLGRTIFQPGGNIRVKYSEGSWVEYNPDSTLDLLCTRYADRSFP